MGHGQSKVERAAAYEEWLLGVPTQKEWIAHRNAQVRTSPAMRPHTRPLYSGDHTRIPGICTAIPGSYSLLAHADAV